jgi:outer membrane lipoprotein SlyB
MTKNTTIAVCTAVGAVVGGIIGWSVYLGMKKANTVVAKIQIETEAPAADASQGGEPATV